MPDDTYRRLAQFGLMFYRDSATDCVVVDESELYRPRSGLNARIMADVQMILDSQTRLLGAFYADDVEQALELVLTQRERKR